MKTTGRLLILSGPSGAGKDTVGELVIARSDFSRLPTYTTREARVGEIDGIHYHFVTVELFRSLVDAGTIFDPVGVHDLYGIPLDKLIAALEQGQDVLMHLAAASAFKVKRIVSDVIIVQIKSPSKGDTQARLMRRGMSQASIARRRENEPDHSLKDCAYDLVLVNKNDNSDQAATEILTYLAQLKTCAP